MSEGSKQLDQTAAAAFPARFLPDVELPANLPDGPVAIADMANAFGVTHRTLHFYEEKGLIAAGRIGPMRIYGHDSIVQMAVISTCREVGMPVAVIQELMEELDGATSQQHADEIFRKALSVRKRELVSSLSTIHRQMQKVTTLLDDDAIQLSDDIDQTGTRAPLLTAAEKQCLDLMAEGYSVLRIARQLEMPLDDVQAMENAIIRKFGASHRFQAVAKAALHGIVKT